MTTIELGTRITESVWHLLARLRRATELFRKVEIQPRDLDPEPERVPVVPPPPGPVTLPHDGAIVALQAYDDRYVYADFARGGVLTAAGAGRGPWQFRTWEQFRWHDLDKGRGALQACQGHGYVHVKADELLHADAPDRADATPLYAVRGPEGTVSFHTQSGHFVTVEPGPTPLLRAGAGEATEATRFRLVTVLPAPQDDTPA
jgi:hypothetical protein